MTTTAVNAGNPTLLDMIKLTDPNGRIAPIIEMLSKRSAILEDATFQEGNLPTGHQFVTRTGLPSIGWRRFNEGVAAGKSREDTINESCGMLEGKSIVDCELAKLNGNEAAFRLSKDKGFMAAMKNEMETGLWYHSTASAPEKFNGLSPRLTATTDPYGDQIVLCDSAASGNDQSSIWLVCWGPDSVFGIYPKGSVGGLTPHDMGEQLINDNQSTAQSFRAYVTIWNWKIGLCVADGRQVVRVANVDATNIAAGTSPIIEAMVAAYHKLYDPTMGRCVWYCNRSVATALHLQALAGVRNSTLSIDTIGGKPIVNFLGFPIRISDGLLSTESALA